MIPRETHEDEMEQMRREVQQCKEFIHAQQQLLQVSSCLIIRQEVCFLSCSHLILRSATVEMTMGVAFGVMAEVVVTVANHVDWWTTAVFSNVIYISVQQRI